MAVGIDKAGKHGPALEVEQSGRLPLGREDVFLSANGQDLAVLHGYGLRHGLGVVDRDDVSVVVNRIGEFLRKSRG